MRWIAYCTLGIAAFTALTAGAPTEANAQVAGAQGETALVKRATELREQPGEASRSLGALAPQSQVTRLQERSGAWIQVRTAQGTTGWLHIFDMTTPNAPPTGGNAASGALRGLTGLFSRGSAPVATTSTSTVGIRGLSAEDLANSQPNMNAVGQVEGMRQDATQAQQFAAGASLATRPMVTLPEPPRPRAPAAPGGPRSPGAPGGGNEG